MAAPKIRADYDALKQVAASFGGQAQATRQTLQALQRQVEVLQGGDWIGQGATAFYQEMGDQVMPTIQRLAGALESAQQSVSQISQIMQQAEADAANVLRGPGGGTGGAAAGAAAAGFVGGSGGSAAIAEGAAQGAAIGAAVGAAIGNPVAGAAIGAMAGAAAAAAAAAGAGTKTSVTPQQAQEIFKNMASQPDIAFNYALDGCYARAYLMNDRIQQQYGVTPSRVWAFGNLSVSTPGPYGQVNWGYHVASVIPVSQPDGSTQMMVIDPSIESGPVPVNQWAATMHTSAANTQITAPGTPPTNPATGQPYPGTGFWPGADPTRFGGPAGYANEVMKRYKQCGNAGSQCGFVPSG